MSVNRGEFGDAMPADLVDQSALICSVPDIQVRIFLASSVGYGPLDFLATCLDGIRTEQVCLMREAEYRRMAGRSGLHRIWLRFRMYVWYPAFLILKIFRAPEGGLFIVTSNTFYAPLIAALAGRARGMVVVQLLYDLFPDALEVAGKLSSNGWRFRLLGRITSATQRICNGTVYLGRCLQAHAEGRWGPAPVSACIDVGTNGEIFSRPVQWNGEKPLRIRYGGQFGYMHDGDTVVECVRKTVEGSEAKLPVSFHFFASGVMVERLRRELRPMGVDVEPPLAEEDWRRTIERFPVGLVSLSPGGALVCLPSKIYGMLAAGQAVIAVCPGWSDLARIVTDSRAGWVINNAESGAGGDCHCGNDVAGAHKPRCPGEVSREFRSLVEFLVRNPEEVRRRQSNARVAAEVHYGRKEIGDRWRAFLRRVIERWPASARR